ncbi:MAG: ABC transporter permease [Thermoleophilia bacterium]
MFFRLVIGSILRARRKKLLIVVATVLAATVAATLLTISLDIRDKMSRELKSYGPNILVTGTVEPLAGEAGAGGRTMRPTELLAETEVPKLKTIFWRNNILDFSPMLEGTAQTDAATGEEYSVEVVGTWFEQDLVIPTGETVRTGIVRLRPWWRVEGRWPKEGEQAAIIGEGLADRLGLRPGQDIELRFAQSTLQVSVVGIASTGDEDGEKAFVPLDGVQRGLGVPGKVAEIEISALTTPENALARKAEADPDSLTPREFELWYCTAYVSAVAYQLEEAVPGALARPVRRVSEAEGAVLARVERLMWLLSLAATVSAGLSISSLMSASVLERRVEIGLAKALGSESGGVIRQFLAEGALLSLAGGLVGFAAGSLIAQHIGSRAFGTAITFEPLVLPATLALSLAIVWASSASAMATIVRLNPKEAIFGR